MKFLGKQFPIKNLNQRAPKKGSPCLSEPGKNAQSLIYASGMYLQRVSVKCRTVCHCHSKGQNSVQGGSPYVKAAVCQE